MYTTKALANIQIRRVDATCGEALEVDEFKGVDEFDNNIPSIQNGRVAST
jgi:hypothetical protein